MESKSGLMCDIAEVHHPHKGPVAPSGMRTTAGVDLLPPVQPRVCIDDMPS